MSAELALRARLLASPVGPLVGGARIYPIIRPQGSTLPALTYQRIAEARFDPLTQPPYPVPPGSPAVALLTLARFQYDAWAGKYPDVLALALEVQRAFRYFTAPPDLCAITFSTQEQLYEADTQTWRVRMDYDVFTEE
jgi:hypothetical protein